VSEILRIPHMAGGWLAAEANVRFMHVKGAHLQCASGRSHKPRNLAKSVTVE